MTELKNDFARLLADEPTASEDLSSVVAAGRRALRRRTLVVSTAGTVGVAAVTAAVVVPTVVLGSSGSPKSSTITVGSSPSPSCRTYYVIARPSHRASKAELVHAVKQLHSKTSGKIYDFRAGPHGMIGLSTCSKAERAQGGSTPVPTPTTNPTPMGTLPKYHYTEQPSHIARRLGAHLSDRLHTWGFTIVYARPFAQETAQLEKGHPKYYDGNDDVQVNGKPADVGVQVTHGVTTQVGFSGKCSAPKCEQTTLADGSVEQTERIHTGSGGVVITVEVHHPNGLVVEAQQANYAFGPQATRSHGRQPLTMAQLKSLATDPAFVF